MIICYYKYNQTYVFSVNKFIAVVIIMQECIGLILFMFIGSALIFVLQLILELFLNTLCFIEDYIKIKMDKVLQKSRHD